MHFSIRLLVVALGAIGVGWLLWKQHHDLERRPKTIAVAAPLTQLDLAEWSGLSREAVVKALRAMRTLGWIRITGREIVLLDRPAIEHRSTA